jgi:glutamate synthase (NADPH) small chain
MGFTGPVRNGLLDSLGVAYDARGNVLVDQTFMTSVPAVFAGGDVRRGASLIVWAIAEGRKMAASVDQYLQAGHMAPV